MKSEKNNLSSQITIQDKSIQEIIKIVANYYHLEEDFVKLKTRKEEIILAKQIAIYLIRTNYPKTTLVKIGSFFIGTKDKGLDHSTILHAIRKVDGYLNGKLSFQKLIREDVKFLQELIEIKQNYVVENSKPNKDYYYICLNNMQSMKIGNRGAIITTGLTNAELQKIKDVISGITEERNHENTNLYILEKRKLETK